MTLPDERTADDAFDALTWSVDCDLLPEGFREPAGYKVTRTGIWQVRTDPRNGPQETRVAYAPIVPVAVFIDPTGAQVLQLAWLDGVKWITKVVPRSVAKSGRKLIATLGDAGLPAVEGDAKGLERWLATVENCNRTILPRKYLARWLGWQPNGTFLASRDAGDIEPNLPEQLAALAAHHARGTLADWQAGIRVIERLPVAKMALYAGLAAPLLDVLGIDSFVVDISGSSTRGKTTAAKIGLSCWADPSEKGDGTFSWRTTMIAIEKRLNLVRGLPVLLDETRVVTKPEMVNDVLYQVSKNHGQARGGGYPSLLAWSTIVISTGEQTALSFTTQQGASARVLTITRPPFGHGTTENGQAAVTVGRAVDEHYGHAGPVFAARLVQELLTGGKEKLVAQHRAFADSLRGGTDISGRRAPLIACLALAAQLAHRWGLLPGLTMPRLEVWQSLFASEDPTDNRPEMALDVAMEFIAANGNAIWSPGMTRTPPPRGWIGRTVDLTDPEGGKTSTTVGLLPQRLREALRQAGVDLDTVLAAWKEHGWLLKGREKGHEWDEKRKLDGANVRMFVFSGDVTAGSEFGPKPEQPRFGGNAPYLEAA